MTASNDPALLRTMASAAYRSERPPGSSRPPFEQTSTEWQDAMHRAMGAAIRAAEADGWRIER
jgi:hypothetical protein